MVSPQRRPFPLACSYTCEGDLTLIGESSHSETSEYPALENTQIIGSCTGLFTAAAVSCSQTLPQLLNVSIELLNVAFNVSVAVSDARNEIEPGDDKPQSWSSVVSGISKDAASTAIDEFHCAAVSSFFLSFFLLLNVCARAAY